LRVRVGVDPILAVSLQDAFRMYVSHKFTAMVKMSKYSYFWDFLALF
jgi:hypothetical protein